MSHLTPQCLLPECWGCSSLSDPIAIALRNSINRSENTPRPLSGPQKAPELAHEESQELFNNSGEPMSEDNSNLRGLGISFILIILAMVEIRFGMNLLFRT